MPTYEPAPTYAEIARANVKIAALKFALANRMASYEHPDQAVSDPVFYELKDLLAREEAN